MMLKTTFADRLKAARHEARKSQQGTAKFLGVARQTYIDLENGLREPRLDMVIELAEYLEIDFTLLATGKKASNVLETDKARVLEEVAVLIESL